MDNFEFHITNNLYNFFRVRMQKNKIPANFIFTHNVEKNKRIDYLVDLFEKENGKLWTYSKKTAESLFGKRIEDSKREKYYATCDIAKRIILNYSLPENYSLYTELPGKIIEEMVETFDKKMKDYATKLLEIPEETSLKEGNNYVIPYGIENFLYGKMSVQKAVELTPIIEKYADIYEDIYDGIRFESENLDAVNYLFDYINALDEVDGTMNIKLLLPLNEDYYINVRNEEIIIEKNNYKVYLENEIDAFDFMESFRKRLNDPKRTKFCIKQKDYPDFQLDIISYSFEKPFDEISAKYIKEIREYTDREIKITDGKRYMKINENSLEIKGSRDDSVLLGLVEKLEEDENFKEKIRFFPVKDEELKEFKPEEENENNFGFSKKKRKQEMQELEFPF